MLPTDLVDPNLTAGRTAGHPVQEVLGRGDVDRIRLVAEGFDCPTDVPSPKDAGRLGRGPVDVGLVDVDVGDAQLPLDDHRRRGWARGLRLGQLRGFVPTRIEPQCLDQRAIEGRRSFRVLRPVDSRIQRGEHGFALAVVDVLGFERLAEFDRLARLRLALEADLLDQVVAGIRSRHEPQRPAPDDNGAQDECSHQLAAPLR